MNARARLEQELESQPQTPSDEGAFAPSTSSVEKQADRLDEFATVYPIPITDFEKARIVWQGLSDDERADAITGAKGYADLCRKQPSRNREDAHRWLRGRKWHGYLAAGKQAEAAAEWCEIDEGSEDWNDWVLFYRCCGKRGFPEFMLTGTEPKRKARVRGRKPPIVGIDPSAEWRKVVERTGPFAAWLRRLTELPNAPIQFGNEAQPGGVYLKTLTVPSEWPPGKSQSSAA